MGPLLFLLFVVVPLAEVYLLVQIGAVVGAGPTLALVLLTGAVGAAMAKREGLRVIGQWQQAMAQGRLPEEGVASGLLLLVGAVLLVTPGLMTDIVGFLLLIPGSRRFLATHLQRWALRRFSVSPLTAVPFAEASFDSGAGSNGAGSQNLRSGMAHEQGDVIDVTAS